MIVPATIIKMLGGDLSKLHTRKTLSDHGSTWKIQSWSRAPGHEAGQPIDEENLFTDSNLRYLVQITEDGIDAYRYDDVGNPVLLDIRPIWRYLWLSKVISEAPPRQFQAHGELCFQDEDGHQIFAAVSITEATFDASTNEFTIVAGRFHVNPALIPDAWRGNVANTLAPE